MLALEKVECQAIQTEQLLGRRWLVCGLSWSILDSHPCLLGRRTEIQEEARSPLEVTQGKPQNRDLELGAFVRHVAIHLDCRPDRI